MARPLRLNIADGWYHVFHRGTERCRIFADDRDRAHFLELLAEMHARYRIRIHGYVLMDNHYHDLLQTPDADLSEAMQWLHTSYAAWFNTRHQRVGPLWQGRFGAVPVENSAWAYELSLYIHLNPVCTNIFNLGKRRKKAEGLGLQCASAEDLSRRLKALRAYTWSSYRSYANYSGGPEWLDHAEILRRAHRSASERKARYREDTKNLLRKGGRETPYESLVDQFAVGGERFREMLLNMAKGGERETAGKSVLRKRIDLEQALVAVEAAKAEPREAFLDRYGDRGKAMAMLLLRRYGGVTLREVGDAFGGLDYAAVSDRVRRLERQALKSRSLKKCIRDAEQNLNLET